MWRNVTGALCAVALIGSFALSAPALAQQKTSKECNSEWSAKKTANQTAGQKKKDFIAACLAPASTAATSAAAPAATATPAKPVTTTKPKTTGTSGANQYASEALAKPHCSSGTVVWANLNTKVYHFSGTKSYGTTKRGAYMCEADATAGGFHAAKGEKHP